MKLTVVGSGSTYTPELVSGLARDRDVLDVHELVLDGIDVMADLVAEHGDAIAEQSGQPLRLIEELGVIPSYYLHYFYAHDEVLAEQLDGVPRAATVAELERRLLELYRDPALDEKPALLEQRGGAFYSEAALALVRSLASDDDAVQVVDTRNGTTLAGLQPDDAVEVPARMTRAGPVPLPQKPLAPELLGLVQHVAAYERLTAEAAVSGDMDIARKALLAHPLIGQYAMVDQLAERLLAEARVTT